MDGEIPSSSALAHAFTGRQERVGGEREGAHDEQGTTVKATPREPAGVVPPGPHPLVPLTLAPGADGAASGGVPESDCLGDADAKAGPADAPAPFDVLAIHEERLRHESGSLDGLAADEHRRAGNPVGLAVVRRPRVVRRTAAKAGRPADELDRRAPDRREPSVRRVQLPGRADQLRTRRAELWASIEPLDELPDSVR